MTSVPLSIYHKCVFSDFFTKINTFEFQLNNNFSGCFYSNDSMYYSCFMDSLSQYFFTQKYYIILIEFSQTRLSVDL